MRTKRSIPRLLAGVVSTSLLFLGGSALPATAAGGQSPATGTAVSASSAAGGNSAAHLDDGNQNTYWQSAGTALPQWAQVKLPASTSVDQVRLKVPASWSARTETLALQASEDANLGMVAYEMNLTVQRVGGYLSTDARHRSVPQHAEYGSS